MTNVNTSYENFKTKAANDPTLWLFELWEHLRSEQEDLLEVTQALAEDKVEDNGFYFVLILDDDFDATKMVPVDSFATHADIAQRVRMALGVDDDASVEWTPDISVHKHPETGVWNCST